MQVKKPEVRARQLKAAAKEFIKKGYEQADLRTIAASAGNTVGNIYRYFKNKDELFKAVIVSHHLTEQTKMALMLERKLGERDYRVGFLASLPPETLRSALS